MKDLNFFSQSLNAARSLRKKTMILLGAIAGIILLIGGIYAVTALTVLGLETDIRKNSEYLNSQEVIQGKQELQNARIQLELLKQYDSAVMTISSNFDSSDRVRSKLIETVNGTIPTGVAIKAINISRQNIGITASAGNRKEIAEFEHNLLDTGLFDEVHIGAINGFEETRIYSFDVNCKLKEVIEK